MRKLLPSGPIALTALLLVPSLAHAQVDAETAYVLNTFSFLVNGAPSSPAWSRPAPSSPSRAASCGEA